MVNSDRLPCVDCICFPMCLTLYITRYKYKEKRFGHHIDRIEKFHAVTVLKRKCDIIRNFIETRDKCFEITRTIFIADYYIKQSNDLN
jgi:hypothetical protein